VPQIVVPHAADQFYWAHELWRRGVGSRPIPRSRLSAATLAEAVAFVLDRPEIGARARQLAVRLDSSDAAGTIADLLLRSVPRFVMERAA
jgi:UDP:flavonoid glycosyltransferase YjiC (YdhE family)